MIMQDKERGASFTPQQGEQPPNTTKQDTPSEDSWPELQKILEKYQRETDAIVPGQAAVIEENMGSADWTWGDFMADGI